MTSRRRFKFLLGLTLCFLVGNSAQAVESGPVSWLLSVQTSTLSAEQKLAGFRSRTDGWNRSSQEFQYTITRLYAEALAPHSPLPERIRRYGELSKPDPLTYHIERQLISQLVQLAPQDQRTPFALHRMIQSHLNKDEIGWPAASDFLTGTLLLAIAHDSAWTQTHGLERIQKLRSASSSQEVQALTAMPLASEAAIRHVLSVSEDQRPQAFAAAITACGFFCGAPLLKAFPELAESGGASKTDSLFKDPKLKTLSPQAKLKQIHEWIEKKEIRGLESDAVTLRLLLETIGSDKNGLEAYKSLRTSYRWLPRTQLVEQFLIVQFLQSSAFVQAKRVEQMKILNDSHEKGPLSWPHVSPVQSALFELFILDQPEGFQRNPFTWIAKLSELPSQGATSRFTVEGALVLVAIEDLTRTPPSQRLIRFTELMRSCGPICSFFDWGKAYPELVAQSVK